VRRTVPGTSAVQTHYIFDEAGHLLAEHDGATGAVLREYVWLDDMPLAMIDSTGTSPATYYIHTGQIEEPLVMTDASKAKVWDAYVEPFGMATVFGTPSANLDLRLPGQFTQAELGALSQNWNRDYDTSLGRYIEADPLGIEAGQNLYGYVGGNPLSENDRSGLAPGIGHNGGPALEGPWVGELLGRIFGVAVAVAWPTDLNQGEDEQICRYHFRIPANWKLQSSKKRDGYVFSDPNNPNNNIRIMRGNPNSPNDSQQHPYVKYHKDGVNYDVSGNPVANDSPQAHVPFNAFNPNTLPK
jgi:RHS repeat-associated protein